MHMRPRGHEKSLARSDVTRNFGGEMFERLTPTARRAIFFARYEAHQAGAPSIGTEHLLLGILRVNTRLAKGITEDLDALRKHLLPSAAEWLGSPGVDVPLSAEAKRVMSLAEQDALTPGSRQCSKRPSFSCCFAPNQFSCGPHARNIRNRS